MNFQELEEEEVHKLAELERLRVFKQITIAKELLVLFNGEHPLNSIEIINELLDLQKKRQSYYNWKNYVEE